MCYHPDKGVMLVALFNRIKEARIKKGFTQEQLGALIGVAKTTVAGYEKCHEPTAAKLGEIADVLDVDVNFLLQDEMREHGIAPVSDKTVADKIKNSPASAKSEAGGLRIDEKDLLTNYNKLNEAGQEDAREHIEFLLTKQKYLRPEYIKSDNSQELA